MLDHNATPPSPTQDPASLAFTADLVVNLLMNIGLTPAVVLTPLEKLLFEVSTVETTEDTDHIKVGVEVARIATRLFDGNDEFREGVISSIANFGHLLSDAPGINAALKDAPAAHVLAEADKAGLLLLLEAMGEVPVLSFMLRGETPKPNSHLLMKLITDRFYSEPAFAADVRNHLADKSTPHTA